MSRFTIFSLTAIILFYIGLAVGHAAYAPLTTGPDELAHFEYLNFIANHAHLPLDTAQRAEASYKSDQPPLYHLLAALPASFVNPTGPPVLKRVQDHERRDFIARTRHAWGLYNTEDEAWPYQAEILRWQIGRWVAILVGALTIGLTFIVARQYFGQDSLALLAAATMAFVPRYLLTGSMLNYETLLALCCTLFLAMLLVVPTSTDSVSELRTVLRSYLPVGFLIGLAVTAKLSAIILPLEIVLAGLLFKRNLGWTWRQVGLFVGTVALGTVIGVSWWFGFVVYQFNSVAENGWWVGILQPLIAADASDATTNSILNWLTGGAAGSTVGIESLDSGGTLFDWLMIFWQTFWAVEIETVRPLGGFGLGLMLILCGLAAWGHFVRRTEVSIPSPEREKNGGNDGMFRQHQTTVRQLLWLHLLLPFILPLIRYLVTGSLADTAQGRHVLFMAGPAMAILLIEGLARLYGWLRPKGFSKPFGSKNWLAIITPAFLLLWSSAQLWTMSWAYLPPLPVRTTEISVPNPTEQSLTKSIALVGYQTELVADRALLKVDLFWRATAISPRDYLTLLSLSNSSGEVVSGWIGYPAQGRYPTRAWDVRDTVRDTTYIPVVNLLDDDYTVGLNLRTVSRRNPVEVLDEPLVLTKIALADLSTGESLVWQDGKSGRFLPYFNYQPNFNYRETIIILANRGETIKIMKQDEKSFKPLLAFKNSALFIVGPDWGTETYTVGRLNEPHAFAYEKFFWVHTTDRWGREFSAPETQHRLEANFGDDIKLLGYDLPSNRAEAGGGLPLTLYWQGLDWQEQDYTVFVRPIAVADQMAYGGRDRFPREGYRTSYWAPDEVVSDPFGVPIAPDAPDGIYHLHVGLYDTADERGQSLPLYHDGQPTEATSVVIGPIKIGRTTPGLTLTPADVTPDQPLNQPFGAASELTLLGYDLTSPDCPTRCQIGLTLYWQSNAPLTIDYTTFVHVRNEADETVAQKDQPPLNGAYPTSLWDAGEVIADEVIIPLTKPIADFQIVLGWYVFQTGQRLPVPEYPDGSFRLPQSSP